jgi:hypothetical protein
MQRGGAFPIVVWVGRSSSIKPNIRVHIENSWTSKRVTNVPKSCFYVIPTVVVLNVVEPFSNYISKLRIN